ncbi:MAG: Uma2 family endonuclease [Spirochaetales bacterium]|nr:Uma2 family endonuclease [Spirochaetales bacterium]
MGLPVKKTEHAYTYGDYKTWPDDERWELIHGTAWNMSPAPSRSHQWLVVDLAAQLHAFLAGQDCELYIAPFDVFLPESSEIEEDSIDTVVQPDLAVICDTGKLNQRGCLGPPDLIVEIISPYTSKKDLNEKFQLYESSGVKEYWIFDPGNKSLQLFSPQDSAHYDDGRVYVIDGIAESIVLRGLKIDIEILYNKMPI